MAWLHGWSGLVVGWVLFFVFLTGTCGYFHYEIDRWMQPERPLVTQPPDQRRALALAESRLRAVAPAAPQWTILLPGPRSSDTLRVSWRANEGTRSETLDLETGQPLAFTPRATGGGRELYVMHWRLRYLPEALAIWIVGLCSMLMLVAIVSGVVTHKKIFTDFFTFRPGKGQRSWLDFHNMLSVFALPYHLMITYSGLIFFMAVYMPWGIQALYGTQDNPTRAFNAEAFARLPVPRAAATGSNAALAPLGPLLQQAEQRWGPGEALRVVVDRRADSAPRIVILRDIGARVSRSRDQLRFDGGTGRLLQASPESVSVPTDLHQLLLGLHEGLFGGPAMRWLFFASGLLGTAMIGTGLILWTSKRRAKRKPGTPEPPGHKLVAWLNVGTIAGLPFAIAVYFWANRLIPAQLPGRADWEVHALFIAWAAAFAYPALRPERRAWIETLWLTAAAFGLLPLLNALTTDRHLGVTLPAGDWVLAGFDLAALGIGILFAAAAWRVSRRAAL